jgi:hypothetical protein
MRKVLKLDVLSVARLFATLYAVIGLYVSAKAVLTGAEKLNCPFGIDYPYLYFRVNINFVLAEWSAWMTPVLLLIAMMFYAITGAISGAIAAIAYNLTSRFWPGIAAIVEPEKAQAQAALEALVVLPANLPPTESPNS